VAGVYRYFFLAPRNETTVQADYNKEVRFVIKQPRNAKRE
jgi:hypothetical protein